MQISIECPKRGLTTRPAALLALEDRITLEALADRIVNALVNELPAAVIWPRLNDTTASTLIYCHTGGWEGDYIVLADIESFYECIDHVLLATFVASQLNQPSSYTRALSHSSMR